MEKDKQIAIEKARALSESGYSLEARERERIGLRKPLKLSLSDEWCKRAADNETPPAVVAEDR